mmetsp:Transcript_1388/g.4043  ORF Transcript_1388/g.4043 Transcript_1388/m.4043 type:complete len:349 (+) Transcript_1388:39-1085(+)
MLLCPSARSTAVIAATSTTVAAIGGRSRLLTDIGGRGGRGRRVHPLLRRGCTAVARRTSRWRRAALRPSRWRRRRRGIAATNGRPTGVVPAALGGAAAVPRGRPARRRLRLVAWELELSRLVPGVEAALALAAVVLRELDEVGDGGVVGERSLQEGGLLVDAEGVLDQVGQVSQLLNSEGLQSELLLEILIVVEGQVLFREARTVRIVQVLLEGMQENMELVAHREQSPILEDVVGEERAAVAEVFNILDGEDVQFFEVDFHLRILLGRLVALLLGLLLLGLCLLGQQGLPPAGVLPLLLQLAPLRQGLLPSRPSLLERLTRLQILHSLGQLLGENPILESLASSLLG